LSSRSLLKRAKRIVIKIGTRVVTDPEAGLNTAFLDGLARQIARLQERKCEVVVVTSGAIHLGRRALRWSKKHDTLALRQAAAAVGQPELMRSYSEALAAHGLIPAQVLLTQDDMNDRKRYLYTRNALIALLSHHIVPVINENDSVSVEGVTFGENDRLAALVATKIRADALILLSDLCGMYTADPRRAPDARLISEVGYGEDVQDYAEGVGGPESAGGMIKKVSASQIAVDCGIPVVMACGLESDIVLRVLAGEEVGTFFVPGEPMPGRKVWIATATEPAGDVLVDDGALKALASGKSLLPAGVTGVHGDFLAGDVVCVCGPDGAEVARGLVNYSAEEVAMIAGAHSREIERRLGHVGHEEIIHRDNMVA